MRFSRSRKVYINNFGNWSWSKPRLSDNVISNILLDFFKRYNIKFKTLNLNQDFGIKTYKTFNLENYDLFIALKGGGFIMFTDKKDNKYLDRTKDKLNSFIDEINN